MIRAMIFLRSLLFNILFYGTTAVMAIGGLPILLLPARVVIAYARLWGRVLVALLGVAGISHRIIGEVPQKQVIYAAKHQSAWETIVLYDLLGAPAPVMKRALVFIPVIGLYFLKAPSVAVDRKAGMRALRSLKENALRMRHSGRSILIFPQGTRVAPGQSRPYQPGVFALYEATGLAVIPIALNSGRLWGRAAFAKKPGVISVEILEEIPPGLRRKEFMARLENTIETASAALDDDVEIAAKIG